MGCTTFLDTLFVWISDVGDKALKRSGTGGRRRGAICSAVGWYRVKIGRGRGGHGMVMSKIKVTGGAWESNGFVQ